MKLLNRLFLLSTLLIATVACSGDESGPESKIETSVSEISISEIGGSGSLRLTATAPWQAKVSGDASWLTINPENGAAGENLSITFTASTYQTGESKEAIVSFEMLNGMKSSVMVRRGDVQVGRTTDSLSLVMFYISTEGERYWRNPWNLNTPMTQWEGVSLENIAGELRVTRLMMQERGLRGVLPEQLKYLSELRNFSVEANKSLSGSFPTFLLENRKLQLLNLADNRFAGAIPSAVFDMPELTWLILMSNQFSGALPTNVGNASNMVTLYLNNNGFTGSLPASLANLTNLEYLSVAKNQFSGSLPSFNQMSNLTLLDLSENAVYVEENLGQYPDLQPILNSKYVGGGFSGAAPKLQNLSKLESVNFGTNNFTTSPEFTNCPALSLVRLDKNAFTSIHTSVLNAPALEKLYVHECKLTALPEVTNENSPMTILSLNNNEIVSLPNSFSKLANLEELYIQENKLTALPQGLPALNKLVLLLIGYNQLTTLPSDFWSMTNLGFVSMPCNAITDQLPENGAAFLGLNVININCCEFSGPVSRLWSFPRLNEVHASQNKLTGDIAPDAASQAALKRLLTLQVLTLDDNQLTGNLPLEFLDLTAMNILHLYNNQLSGVVPTVFYNSSRWCEWGPIQHIKTGNPNLQMEDRCQGS